MEAGHGAAREHLVAAALETLAPYGWTSLHDVHWPGRPKATIDHVVIGPGGVVVIDTRNWSGGVTVREGLLRQNGSRRDEQVSRAADAASAVTALLSPEHRMATCAVLCLAGQDLAPTPCTGVVVVGLRQLTAALVAMPQRLDPHEVAHAGRHLTEVLAVAPRSTPRQRSSPRAWSGVWSEVRGGLIRLAVTVVALWVLVVFAQHMALR